MLQGEGGLHVSHTVIDTCNSQVRTTPTQQTVVSTDTTPTQQAVVSEDLSKQVNISAALF